MSSFTLTQVKWIFFFLSIFCVYAACSQLINAFKHKVISGDVKRAENPILFWFIVFAFSLSLIIFIPMLAMTTFSIVYRFVHA